MFGISPSGHKFAIGVRQFRSGEDGTGSILLGVLGVVLVGIVLAVIYAVYGAAAAYIGTQADGGESKAGQKALRPPGRLEKIALYALVLLAAALCWTGFGQYFALSDDGIFLAMLHAHTRIGMIAVLVLVVYAVLFAARRFRAGTAALIVAYPFIFVWLLLAPTPLILSLIVFNGFLFPGCIYLFARRDTPPERRSALAAAGITLFAFTFVVLTGFFSILNPATLRFSFYHRIFHAFIAPCALFIPLYFYFAGRRGQGYSGAAGRGKIFIAGVAVIACTVLGGSLHALKNHHLANIRLGSTFATKRMSDNSKTAFRTMPAGLLTGDDFCGSCHQLTYAQWLRSTHANAARTLPFQKTARALMLKHGAEFVRDCASCHDPEVAFSADPAQLVNSEHVKRSQGVSRRTCHYMRFGGIGNELYSIAVPRSDFIYEPVPGKSQRARTVNSVLDTRDGSMPRTDHVINSVLEHVGDVSGPDVKSGAICFPCHRLESVRNVHKKIPIDNVTSFLASDFSLTMPCYRCDMPRIEQDEHNYSWMDHSFFGIQTELPDVAIGPDSVLRKDMRRFSSDTALWIAGRLPALDYLEAFIDETVKSYRINNYFRTSGQLKAVIQVAGGGQHFDMKLESVAARTGGIALTFSTSNRNISHDFPSSLFANITETWFELQVTDSRGRSIFSGGFDARDYTHRLGRLEVDAAGVPIKPEDSLKYVEIVNKKYIEPGKKYMDAWFVPVPSGAEYPLHVNYSLMYRRYSDDFTAWFSDGKLPPVKPIVMCSGQFSIPRAP